MWNSLQTLLPKAAGKYNFALSLKAIEICQEYRKLAVKLLPSEVLEYTFPKYYENQVLTVGVLNSVWAEQLQIKKHILLEEMNKKYHCIIKLRIVMSESLPASF